MKDIINSYSALSYLEFEQWLDNILSNNLPKEIVAFCFNIYEDGDDEWSLELIGSESFEKNNSDWPCDEIYTNRESPLRWENSKTWEDTLKMIKMYLEQYIRNGKFSHVLLEKQGVGYGFVDGDLFLVE